MNEDKFVMAKAANTVNSRLAEGQVVTFAEVRAGGRDPEAWRKAGILVPYDSKTADKAAREAKDAGGLILAGSPDPVPQPDISDSVLEPKVAPEPEIRHPSRRR